MFVIHDFCVFLHNYLLNESGYENSINGKLTII
jgi:hypothetical protein